MAFLGLGLCTGGLVREGVRKDPILSSEGPLLRLSFLGKSFLGKDLRWESEDNGLDRISFKWDVVCFSFKIGPSFVTCNSSKADDIFDSCDCCNGVAECCRGFLEGRGRLLCVCGGSSWGCGPGGGPHPLDAGSLKMPSEFCVKIGVSDWSPLMMMSCRKWHRTPNGQTWSARIYLHGLRFKTRLFPLEEILTGLLDLEWVLVSVVDLSGGILMSWVNSSASVKFHRKLSWFNFSQSWPAPMVMQEWGTSFITASS